VRTSIIVFPGSDCDCDEKMAFERFTGRAPAMI